MKYWRIVWEVKEAPPRHKSLQLTPRNAREISTVIALKNIDNLKILTLINIKQRLNN